MKKFIAAGAGLFLIMPVMLMPMAVQAETIRDKTNTLWAGTPQAFPDVPTGHANFNAVAMLTEDETIKGYPDGTFKPDGQINRAELTKMVVSWFTAGTNLTTYKNCFPDVKTEWFAPYICYAKSKGWVGGYPDGTFKPSKAVTRVEAIKIVSNVMIPSSPVDYWPSPTAAEKQLPLPTDADKTQWYNSYLAFAVAKELLDGQHVTGSETAFYYKSGEPMTRKEVAEMMYRIWLYMVERVEYADIMSMATCVQTIQTDKTEAELHAAWLADLADMGMTEDDANQLHAKYSEDEVIKDMIADSVKECTKQPVDLSKWDFLLKYSK